MANLSKQKRERMLQFLNTIKEEHKDNSNVLVALSEIETELQNKKYGLVWEKHEEQVDIMMKENIPVFTEVKEKEITADKDKPYNFLLEGDNLHSLKLLEKTHKGKIDVIYIDPPYNTGNKDFVYDDKIIDKNDGYSHSKWLSFMSERLTIARKLLSDKGMIFISIDDNEHAQLRMLCDSIFGENNFLTDFVWLNNLKGRQISKGGAVKTYEHILLFAKKSENIDVFSGNIKELGENMPLFYKKFKYEEMKDDIGNFIIKNELYNTNSAFNEETRPNLVFNIFYNDKTKDIKCTDIGEDLEEEDYIKISPHSNSNGTHKYHAWRWSRKKIINESSDLYFVKYNDTYKIYTKIRDMYKTNIKDVITDSTNGNNELNKIIGKGKFSYPKPIKLCYASKKYNKTQLKLQRPYPNFNYLNLS